MPVLKNAKWEAFAQGLFAGLTGDEAYEKAGYKPNRGNAARLKANDSILKRLAELQSKASEKAEWNAADRLAALKRIQEATEKGDPRVAVSAIAEANKMQGSHAPAKLHHGGANGGPIEHIDLSRLTEEELNAYGRLAARVSGLDPDAIAGAPETEAADE